jgi:hypothetical protein
MMNMQGELPMSREEARKRALDRRLDGVGWGLFLIMIGGLWLAPAEWGIPDGAWLVGAGLIILGLSAVRHFNNLRMSGFWLFLGALALGSGLAAIYGLDLPVLPILLVIAGAAILLKPLFDNRQG